MEPFETYTHKGVNVTIYYDDHGDVNNPRDNDNLATMVCWHPDYVLGDYQFTNGDGRGAVETPAFESWKNGNTVPSMRALARMIGVVEKGICIMPLYLYDHSGISISAGTVNPFDNPTVRRDEFGNGMGWDTTMVGFIYTTPERIRELCGEPQLETDPFYCPRIWDESKGHVNWPRERSAEEWIREQLLLEVKEYDAYLRGEVYGFVVDEDGPDEESCWGFIGDVDYCKQEANEAAEGVAQERAWRHKQRGRALHRMTFA